MQTFSVAALFHVLVSPLIDEHKRFLDGRRHLLDPETHAGALEVIAFAAVRLDRTNKLYEAWNGQSVEFETIGYVHHVIGIVVRFFQPRPFQGD